LGPKLCPPSPLTDRIHQHEATVPPVDPKLGDHQLLVLTVGLPPDRQHAIAVVGGKADLARLRATQSQRGAGARRGRRSQHRSPHRLRYASALTGTNHWSVA